MTDTRKAIHAYVTNDAHEQWQSFAADAGVSVSAMLEVLGSSLPSTKFPTREPEIEMTDLIRNARKVDAQRRRRS